jgi:hypothetical protein
MTDARGPPGIAPRKVGLRGRYHLFSRTMPHIGRNTDRATSSTIAAIATVMMGSMTVLTSS